METKVCVCGCEVQFLRKKNQQIGLYCAKCEKWFKWVGKKEIPNYVRMGLSVLEEGTMPTENFVENMKEKVSSLANTVGGRGATTNDAPPLPSKPSNGYIEALNYKKKEDDTIGLEYCPLCETGAIDSIGKDKTRKFRLVGDALTVTKDDTNTIIAATRIKYCFLCGRKLDTN